LDRDHSSNEVSGIVRRHRWVVLSSLFLGLAVASAAALLRPREYECRTRIEVGTTRGLTPSELAARVGVVRDDLRKPETLAAAANALGLRDRSPEELAASTRAEAESPRGGVCVLHVGHTSPDPETSRRVVEALVGGYRREIYELPRVRQQGVVDGLRKDLESATATAERARSALAEHEAKYAELLGPLAEQRQSVQQEIVHAEEEAARHEQSLRDAEASLAAEPQYRKRETRRPDAEKMGSLVEELDRLRAQVAELKGKLYGDDHPDVVALRASIAEVDRKRSELEAAAPLEVVLDENPVWAEHARQKSESAAGLKAARQRLQSLNRTDRELQDRMAQVPPVRARREQLAGERKAAEEARDRCASELAAAEDRLRTVGDERVLEFRVVDAPATPRTPAGTAPALLALGGIVLGSVAGVSAAWLADSRDRSFRDADAVAAFVGLPAIGAVGEIETPDEAASRREATRKKASLVAVLALAATGLAGWAVWDGLPSPSASGDVRDETR
jgi:uncharacterized protein involved in exopolysaccharide biosynthesis